MYSNNKKENTYTPWELVGVDDLSQLRADADYRYSADRFYIWNNRAWRFIVETEDWNLDSWRFISKKAPKKKKVTIEITDEQLEQIKKIINQ